MLSASGRSIFRPLGRASTGFGATGFGIMGTGFEAPNSGSYYDKLLRVQRVCSWVCESIRQSGVTVRPGVVHKAALLSKADLTTELVKEFTELQGVVGGLYARVQGEPEDVRLQTIGAVRK